MMPSRGLHSATVGTGGLTADPRPSAPRRHCARPPLIGAPGVVGAPVARKRRAHGDDQPDLFGRGLGQLAGEQPAQAPPHQHQRLALAPGHDLDALGQPGKTVLARPEIEAQPPVAHRWPAASSAVARASSAPDACQSRAAA
jgi:hypothetical protein